MDDAAVLPAPLRQPDATALARRLVETRAGEALDKVLFAPSGSAAVGMALKLARYATGRHKTLSLWDLFHGANLDAIGVGGEALFRRGLGPMTPGAEHLPPLDLARRFFGDDRPFDRLADFIDYSLDVQGDVAALIAEPLRWTTVAGAAAGILAARPRVLRAARRAADLRRDPELPGALRGDVRLPTAGRDARHPGHRQGARRRNHAAGGDSRRRRARLRA